MNKKTLSFFLILLLICGCGEKQEEEKKDRSQEIEYLDPVRDVFIYSELDELLQERIKKANCNEEFKNYQFQMLGTEIYEDGLKDIHDDDIDLKSFELFCLDVVSVECGHCRKQLPVIADLAKESDIPIIQYFNVGTTDEILDLYEEEDVDIPEQLIVIPRDQGMAHYISSVLGLKQYPTFVSYENGKVVFNAVGEIDEESFDAVREISFSDPVDADLIREKMELNRSVEDLKADLSSENLAKLEALDHDDYTMQLSFELMGRKLDFDDISRRKSDVYLNQIDDFSVYEDKRLVLIYTYLRDNSETEKVKFINELMSVSDEVDYIVVLIEGMESSSAALKNMQIGFTCPVASNLGYMPDDFYSFGLIAYPTAVFVDRGTFTGAYSDITDKETFENAIDIFLSDDSIAYKHNN